MRGLLRTTRRGVTLAEAVITIVLVGVMLVAAINTLGVSKAGQQVVRDERLGRQLGEQLMAEILSHPYADETVLEFLKEEVLVWETPTGVTLGPETGEVGDGTRAKFDDIDDYDTWSSKPPEDAAGKPIAGADEYTRSVSVTLLDATDADLRSSGAQESGARRVTVAVRRNGVAVERLEAVVALGPPATQACFLPDGSCLDLPSRVCADLGGTAQGAGSRCAVVGLAVADQTASLPLHHWAMDEGSGSTAADSMGTMDLDILGSAGTMWKSGVVGSALYFDGGDSAKSPVKFDPPRAATVAFWLRSPGRPIGEGEILGTDNKWVVRYMPSGSGDGVPGGVVFDLGLSWRMLLNPEFATSVPVDEPGRWYHLAATYDSSDGTYAVYIDGAEDVSGSGGFDFPKEKTLEIGDGFEGVLDDVRIYDRVLTSEEIAELVVPAPDAYVRYAGLSEDYVPSKSDSINKWALPAGTADGDLLIATVVTSGDTTGTHSPPAGWTLLGEAERYSEVTVAVFWKIAASEPADYRFQWGDRQQAYGMMTRFTGHDPADPIEAWSVLTTGSGVTTTPPSPGAVSSVDDVLVLRVGGFDDDDISVGAPGLNGHVAIAMDKSKSGNGTVSGGAGYRMLLGAGDSGISAFSLSDMEQSVCVTVLIKPAPVVEAGP